ncbi:MAG TPA: CHRD domain-containing protein [Casimicrobiaceae bacterium]|nr:CHRD domain-containing protein [Casimicrobiaceae bacterium]
MKLCLAKKTAASFAVALVAAFSSASQAQGTSTTLFTAELNGYNEVPSISTLGTGFFIARIRPGDSGIDYTLGYSQLQGTPTQAHIHFGQPGVAGGISIWLCGAQTQSGVGPTTCPTSGAISGSITAGNVIGPTPQLIGTGELSEIIAAMRAGFAYANVHSDQVPSGEIRGQIRGLSGF